MFYLSDLSIPGSERCVHDGIEKGRENSSTVEAPKSLFREEKGTSDEVLEKTTFVSTKRVTTQKGSSHFLKQGKYLFCIPWSFHVTQLPRSLAGFFLFFLGRIITCFEHG